MAVALLTEAAKAFLDVLKLAPRYLVAPGVMAAVLLFGDGEFLKFIGVFEFAQDNRLMLGLALVAVCSLCAVSAAAGGIAFAKAWRAKRNRDNRVIKRLNSLTEDEKQILRHYIFKQMRANSLRVDDGVVQGLVAEGVIYLSAPCGTRYDGFAHNIAELAREYIRERQHLLKGTTAICRTDREPPLWE